MAQAKGLSLLSGGLDSQLAVCVLREAGAYMEGITFETPFFSADNARKAAKALDLPLTVVDFTADEIALVKNPPHGYGGAMNPCIDCHATMIRRAGEIMRERGFDFVSTGEVVNQRPMSQTRQSLGVVARTCGLEGRLVRPLSAQLLQRIAAVEVAALRVFIRPRVPTLLLRRVAAEFCYAAAQRHSLLMGGPQTVFEHRFDFGHLVGGDGLGLQQDSEIALYALQQLLTRFRLFVAGLAARDLCVGLTKFLHTLRTFPVTPQLESLRSGFLTLFQIHNSVYVILFRLQ